LSYAVGALSDERANAVGSTSDVFETGAKVLGVLTVLLPALGVVIRWVAFGVAGVPQAAALAIRAPVPDLAITAFQGAGLFVAFLFLGILVGAASRRLAEGSTAAVAENEAQVALARQKSKMARLAGGFNQFLFAAAIAFFVLSLLIGPDFPIQFLRNLVALLAGLGIGIAEIALHRALRLVEVGAVMLPVALILAVLTGLDGTGVGDQVGTYRFTHSRARSGLPQEGNYVSLARADGTDYLQSCKQPSLYVGVNTRDVVRVDLKSIRTEDLSKLSPIQSWLGMQHERPSLIGILVRRNWPHVGYRPECP
jgi:hypothetical protein